MKAVLRALAAATALALGGCAGLPAAEMALPETLAATAPAVLRGLGHGREGRFELDGLDGRFERGADRLTLGAAALTAGHAGLGFTLGQRVQAHCSAHEVEAGVAGLGVTLRPYELRCEFGGVLPGRLRLQAGARGERRGEAEFGAIVLTLQSVQRVKGSPLPLEAPIGYVFLQQGRPVGAVELNGAPRLWRPPAGTPLHDAVTQAALALALSWAPDA